MNTYKVKPVQTVADSQKYLQKHRIKELLNFLMAHVIIHQPEDPVLYLADLLDECMLARLQIKDPPTLFDTEHIQQIFKSFDPTKSGTITKQQFKTGLATMGIVNPHEPLLKGGKVTMDVFELEAKTYLSNYFKTFINSK